MVCQKRNVDTQNSYVDVASQHLSDSTCFMEGRGMSLRRCEIRGSYFWCVTVTIHISEFMIDHHKRSISFTNLIIHFPFLQNKLSMSVYESMSLWYDLIKFWYDMMILIWYDLIWSDMMIWYDPVLIYDSWYDYDYDSDYLAMTLTWYDSESWIMIHGRASDHDSWFEYDMIRYDMIWFDMILFVI